MQRYFDLFLVLLLLFSLSNCKNYTDLHVEDSRTITLNPTTPKLYRIVIPSNVTSKQDLYIHVQPTITDPFQVPHLTLTSDNHYQQKCYNAHQQFAGICKIDSQQLQPNRQFILSIKCITDCSLDLQTYLSNIITLTIGQELNLNSKSNAGLTAAILIEIPIIADYTTLCILATITNVELNTPTQQKLDMLVNYGKADTPVPTDDNYTLEGLLLFTGGRGLYLSKKEVPPGSWITVYLRMQKGISVTFSVREMLQGNSQITIGSSYFEYIDQQHHQKIYYVNLPATVPSLSTSTIEFVFSIYSGDPTIEIGFDRDFQRQVPFTRQTSAISYSISPTLRQNYNFTDTLYIRVSVTMPSEYYFYSKIDREDATYMQPYLTYLDEISKDEVENYFLIERYSIFQDSIDNNMNYAFKIDTIKGYGSFYFRRCQNLQLQSNRSQRMDLSQCLIVDSRELRNASFKREQIQNEHIKNGNKMSILMNYDISNCSDIVTKDTVTYKECAFQILAIGESYEPFIYSITAERKFAISYLKENSIVKDFIYKDNYVFYAFSLPSIQNVTKIEIFLTTFSGEAALIVSTVEHQPTFKTQLDQIQTQTGEKSSIILQGSKLANQIYISVYAYQFTEVNLGVIVHRTSDMADNNLNTIVLEKDNLLTYTLDTKHSTVSFKFNSQSSESIVVSLNELVGHCTFKIFDQSKMQLSCVGKRDNILICQVNTIKDTDYLIQVTGDNGKNNKFTISYKYSIEDCTAATLNLPIDVVLHASDSECFTFPINRNIDLKLATSLTYIQNLNQQVLTSLYANGLFLSQIIGNHFDIMISSLNIVCPLNHKNLTFAYTCLITVNFINNSTQTSHFNFIVQQSDAQIALFDGIVQKSSGSNFYGKVAYYYYHLYNTKPLRVFLTSQSVGIAYTMVAQIVDKTTFLSRHEGPVKMHQDYLDKMYNKYNGSNLFATSGNFGTSILSIDDQIIKTHCPNEDCYLLISVASQDYSYVQDTMNDMNWEEISYEIEVTQEQTFLSLGDTKVGFIEKDQIYTYLIDPQDAYLTIRNMNNEGRQTTTCATMFISYNDNGTTNQYAQLNGNYQMQKSDGIHQIYLRGDTDQCSYQISYISLKQPVKNVHLSMLYELNIQNTQIEGFLFYNKHPSSFRIMQMMSAGSADIYILPFIQNNITLDAVFKLDFNKFPMVDNLEGDFLVSATSEHFCWNCFYYVVVATKSRFIGQIVFLRLTDPIPLTVSHMFKQTLKPSTQIAQQQYVFYSLTAFNLTFHMISGSISVVMIDPQRNYSIYETISQTKTFSINAIDYKSKQKIEFYSSQALYRIMIVALSTTEFYLQLERNRATQRIFQGYPVVINLKQNIPTVIQFVNSQAFDKPITIMASIDSMAKIKSRLDINIDLKVQLNSGSWLNSSQVITKTIVAEQTIVYNLKSVPGTYFINITSNLLMNFTFLLFQNQLTHLTPAANHFFNNIGIFQLASNDQYVMVQIFNCKGDLAITASNSYQAIIDPNITNNSLITLKRPNYAGHYVFGVENGLGSYFLKVTNKEESSGLQYLIDYYYTDGNNPYDSIDAVNYDVIYTLSEEGVVITVNAPALLEVNDFRITNISYWAYAAVNQQNLNRYSRCSVNDNIFVFPGNSSSFFISVSLIESYLSTQTAADSLFLNVEASLEIEMIAPQGSQPNKYPTVLTILYNTIELPTKRLINGSQSYKYWFTDNFLLFMVWMLLPFFLAGLALTYLLKCCMRKLMMRQKDMVEEIDMRGTTQTIPEGGKTDGYLTKQEPIERVVQHTI